MRQKASRVADFRTLATHVPRKKPHNSGMLFACSAAIGAAGKRFDPAQTHDRNDHEFARRSKKVAMP
jgi:hypothetical protein